MLRRTPISTLTDPLCPSMTLFRSAVGGGEPDHPDPGDRADDHRGAERGRAVRAAAEGADLGVPVVLPGGRRHGQGAAQPRGAAARPDAHLQRQPVARSVEHTSELQSLMSISYAGLYLNKKNN